ncbi:MAG: hypothetical protein QM796_19340 [Chthoniobacteraceae bacterium]
MNLVPNYEISQENNSRQWPVLGAFCQKHNCYRVLSTAKNPQRKVGTLGAYKSGVELAATGLHLKIACLWEDYVPDDLTRFFENVSANRGIEVRFFQEKELAMTWLLGAAELQPHV